jgi:hypothetical protein
VANTLTGLIPTIYEALNIVSRELIGFIPAVTRNSAATRAALNQVISVPLAPSTAAADVTPGVTAPNTGDLTMTTVNMQISKSRYVPIRWNGEETLGLGPTGNYRDLNAQRFAQAFRTLANEMESDLAGLYTSASRAVSTAGTTPFGTASDLTDGAFVRQVLDDNGVPQNDLHLVLGSAAMANIRGKQSVLFKVNEAGTDALLRRGVIGELQGFSLHNSSQIKLQTKGTGASYTTNTAGYAVGATAITLITGTGTILAGDVVTFAGDSNKYVVAGALSGGVITLANPGLLVAIPTSATAVTVGNNYRANLAFQRSAIQLITRVPALPEGGDDADDRMTVTDPVSGLSFEVAIYRQYRQIHIEVALAWGVAAIKSEHMAILMG